VTTYRLMDGASGRPGNGPGTATSYAGNLVVGTMFCVTQGGLWLEGYYWWVPGSGGDTASGQKFALWQLASSSTGSLVPGGTVTAGALTAGAWNYIALPAPLLLAPSASNSYGAVYMATTGKVFTGGFPETKNQFSATQPFAAGITNGPLTAPSSSGGSAAAGSAYSWTKPQCPYSASFSDPTAGMPGANDSDANLWLDVQVSDTPPASPAYRAFPNAPTFVVPGQGATNQAYTLGLEFTLSQACTLQKIWHYSPSGATVLPTRCGIWDVNSQTEVAGSDNSSPTWLLAGGGAAAAAGGWVYCDYSGTGVTLNASQNYKVSTFTSDNTDPWFFVETSFWGGSPGPFSSAGITQGPITYLPNSAASPGQNSWHQSTTWTYPGTSSSPEYDVIDVEVTPYSAPAPPAVQQFVYQMRMMP